MDERQLFIRVSAPKLATTETPVENLIAPVNEENPELAVHNPHNAPRPNPGLQLLLKVERIQHTRELQKSSHGHAIA